MGMGTHRNACHNITKNMLNTGYYYGVMCSYTLYGKPFHDRTEGREDYNMSVTIKQISEICGVSRGTVDRVLNNRGRVKPQTEQLVRNAAAQLGYVPNIAGRALAAKKKAYTIGCIVNAEGNVFFDEVLRGIRRIETELADYGTRILLKTMKGYDTKRQLELIEELVPQINALVITPISDPEIEARINELCRSGMCVVAMNTDIENTGRLCYVGSDYYKGGETACGMLGILTGGNAKIGMLTGSVRVLGHAQRIAGFRNVASRKFAGFEIVDVAETNDDEIVAYDVTRLMLEQHSDINALYVVAGGVYGVCRAVLSMRMKKKVKIICFDKTPTTVEMMKKGVIAATICQQPYTQGYRSVRIAFDYLVSGIKPQKEEYIVKTEIKILENL